MTEELDEKLVRPVIKKKKASLFQSPKRARKTATKKIVVEVIDVGTLEDPMAGIFSMSKDLEEPSSVADVALQLAELRRDFNEYKSFEFTKSDLDKVPFSRCIPVRVYLSEESEGTAEFVCLALRNLLDEYGFTLAESYPIELGSFFQRFIYKTKKAATKPEVAIRLKKAERAIELATLDKTQASIDKSKAEAAGILVKSLEYVPNGACQVGSILVVKTTDDDGPRILIRSLSNLEMIYLEENPQDLYKPQLILKKLTAINKLPEVEVSEAVRTQPRP